MHPPTDRIDIAHVGCGGTLEVHATQALPPLWLPPGKDLFSPELAPFFVIRCRKCGLSGRRLRA